MAITAKFEADFVDFNRGVKDAEQSLVSFQDQVDRSGGRLMDLKGYTDTTAAGAGGLTKELQRFDSLLGTVGIHLSGPIRALGELSDAAGKSVKDVGLLGTAGLAAGAAIGGWQLGRAIADLTGADKWVESMATHLFGWSDAAERAGAKADVLALASKNAGHEVTDFNEAMIINRAAADKMAAGQETVAAATRATADAVHAAVEQTVAASNRATDASAARAKAERDMWNEIGVGRMDYEAVQQASTDREAAQLRAFYNEMGVLAQNAWKPEPIIDWVEKIDEALPAVEALPTAVSAADTSVQSLGRAAQQAASSFFSMSAELYNAIRAAQQWDDLAGKDKGIYTSTIGGIGGSSASTRWGQANVSVNINGSVLGNKDEIARVVGDAVTSSYRTGGNRLPV